MMRHSFTLLSLLCLGLATLTVLMPFEASAQTTGLDLNSMTVVNTSTPTSANTCTNFSGKMAEAFSNSPSTQPGLLSGIYLFITETVNTATQNLFVTFTSNSNYQAAVYGAITLMIVFYAVGFTIGVVQPSFQQALVRLFKIGIVFSLISPGGWQFFNNNVVQFFQQGSDDIITKVQSISMPGITVPDGATPFYALDRLAEFIIQPDTIIAIMGAIAAGGPFGLSMGGLLFIAVGGFLMLVLTALKIYAIAFVARALVLGLAPIFFVFLLFDRTKNMFVAWVNALVNLSLRPILLFTFLSFFIVMIEGAAKNMLGATELCWTEYKSVSGTVNNMAFWKYVDPKTRQVITGDMTYKGSLECLISPEATVNGARCPEFPINIVDLLSFLILVYIAKRFADVIDRIASELSNAFVGLDTSGKMEQLMHMGKSGGGGGGLFSNNKAGGQKK